MKRYLCLFVLYSSLTFAETDLEQDIYETIVETMLIQGATTLACTLKATYTIDLGMNKRITEDNGEKTIILYIGDFYIFERIDGYLENLAYRETEEDAWGTLSEDKTSRVSEASIFTMENVSKERLNLFTEVNEANLIYKSMTVDTSINRYTGAYSKKINQTFITEEDLNREVGRTDNLVGECAKAPKAKF